MNAKLNWSKRQPHIHWCVVFVCVSGIILTRAIGVSAEEPTAVSDAQEINDVADQVSRPTKALRLPNPREFVLSLDDHGRVPPFNFIGQPWPDVLQWLATLSECSLDWQELPRDYLNLTTQQSHSVEEVRDLLNRHLSARGYTILDRDKVLSVFKIDALDPNLVPKVSEEDLFNRSRYDFVKVTFELPAGVSALEFSVDVKQVLSRNATVVPLISSNRLLVMDTVANLRGLTELLNGERAAQDASFREFVLRNARAELVIDTLYAVLGISSQSDVSRRDLEQQQRERLQTMSQVQERMAQIQERTSGRKLDVRQMFKQGGVQDVHLAFNRRRNSILVNAPPEFMKIIQRAIQAIDVPTDSGIANEGTLAAEGKTVKKYGLKTAPVEMMLQTINEVGGLGPGAEVRGDPSTKSLIVLAEAADHEKVAKLIEQLDGAGRRFEVMPLRRLAADSVAVTVYHLMVGQESGPNNEQHTNSNQANKQLQQAPDAGFRVDADVENNRLLLWADETELKEVRRLLAQLGEVPGERGGQPMVRVLGPFDRSSPEKVLEQVKGAWSSFSENKLIIEDGRQDKASKKAPASKEERRDDNSADHDGKTAADLQVMNEPPTWHRAIANYEAAQTRFADLRVASSAGESGQPPLIVNVTEDGQVILSSPDANALDAFEKLWKIYSPPEARFKVFRLQHVSAYPVWLNLTEYFSEELGESNSKMAVGNENPPEDARAMRMTSSAVGLSQRRKLQIIYDTPSNSILVANASGSQLEEIRQLLEEYDRPAPAKSIKARRTAAIKVRYSSAATIAAALKEVYRDLLSSRDKEFETEDKKLIGTASEAPTIIRYGVEDKQQNASKVTEPVKVRFDGSLSIGVDEGANMLIISAQEELFDSIVDTIEQLDAAIPRQTVKVHAIRGGMSGSALSNALSAALNTPVQMRKSQQSEQVQIQPTNTQQQTVVQPRPKKFEPPKQDSSQSTKKGEIPGSRDSGNARSADGGKSAGKASGADRKNAGTSD
jgi:type II secretory pathway component GspD/PulD (secretin)